MPVIGPDLFHLLVLAGLFGNVAVVFFTRPKNRHTVGVENRCQSALNYGRIGG